MSVYDLDRFSKRTASISTAKPSLTLHLYPNHARFEHQNGVFKYDSPILPLLDSIRHARLPVALLDLLDATEVQYIDGCLIVEIRDHRLVDNDNGLPTAALASANGITSVIRDPLSVSASDATMQGHPLAKSVLGKRSANGALKSPSLSHKDGAMLASSGETAAVALHKRFTVTYHRFQEARLDAEALKLKAMVRSAETGATVNGPQGAASASPTQSSPKRGSFSSGTQVPKTGAMNTSLHNAVAAAISATSAANASVPPLSSRQLAIEPVPTYRVILQPDSEAVWADICSIRNERTIPKSTVKASSAASSAAASGMLSDQELLGAEARILALTAPPLCLSPDPDLCRIANSLMAASALPSFASLAKLPMTKVKKRKAGFTKQKPSEYDEHFFGANPSVAQMSDVTAVPTQRVPVDDDRPEAAINADDLLAQTEQTERARKQEWLLVMDESHGRPFQPRWVCVILGFCCTDGEVTLSFKRVAFLQDWRNTKAEEARRHEQAATQRPLQAGQMARTDIGVDADVSLLESLPADVQVGALSNGDIAVEDVHRMLLAQEEKSQVAVPQAPVQPAPPQKKKKAKAGSPAPDVAVGQAGSGTGTSNLKFTLPGRKSDNNVANGTAAAPKKKKKDKKAAAAAQAEDVKVDIAVSMPTNSASHTNAGSPAPNSALSASSGSAMPTPAQQAIMKKASSLPKSKLKSEVSAQILAQTQSMAVPTIPSTSDISVNGVDGNNSRQGRTSPSKQTGAEGGLPTNVFPATVSNLPGVQVPAGASPQQAYAATLASQLPAGMTPHLMQQAAQRAFSPMQNAQMTQAQQQVYQQAGGPQAMGLSAAQLAQQQQQQQTQQAYLAQLSKQASAASNGELQAGLAMQRPGSVQLGAAGPPLGSFPQQQNAQNFASQLPHQMNMNGMNPYININRSPMHANNTLGNVGTAQQAVQMQHPQLQQGVPNMNGAFNGQQQYGAGYHQGMQNMQMQSQQNPQITPQQAMQLLAYTQQQQRANAVTPQPNLAPHHQQQLLNISNHFAGQQVGANQQYSTQQMLNTLQLQQSQAQMQQMQGQQHMQMFPMQNQQQWQQTGR